MLSTKTLLKNDRYRLDDLISAGTTAHLYKAFDNLLKQPIVILKNDAAPQPPADLEHDGLVRIADRFQEGGSSYTVTEALAENISPSERSAENIFRRLGVILLAISSLKKQFPFISTIEITPQTVFTTADRKLKLLFTYPAQVVTHPDPVNSPYLPLEKIWDELDHINQKAIYRTYDESAMAVLESPPDDRSDLYSLGAVFYKLLTSTAPLSAFERSIDMLDTRVDSLVPPAKLIPGISAENSAFIIRLLELRRERRFGSTEDAIFSLPTPPKMEVARVEETADDDLELLEIPEFSQAPAAVRPAASMPASKATAVVATLPVVETFAVEQPLPKKPIFMEMIAEPIPVTVPEPTPEVAQEPTSSGPRLEPIVSQAASPLPDPFSEEIFLSVTDEAQPRQRKPMKIAAIFAFAVVLLGIGAWGFFALNTSSTSAIQPPATVILEQPQIADIPVNVPAETIPQSTAANIQPAPSAEPAVKTDITEPGPQQAKPRPQIAETKPAKTVEKRPNEEKPKKKLTVDDLINDN